MANFLLPVAFATALAAGAAVVMTAPMDPVHDQTANLQSEWDNSSQNKTWVMSAKGSPNICLLSKQRAVSANTFLIDVDPSCLTVFEDSALVSVWQQDGQGAVTLADQQGHAVVEFAYDAEGTLSSISGEPGAIILSPNS